MAKKEKWEIIAKEYVVSLFPIFTMSQAFSLGFRQKYKKISVDFVEKIKDNNVEYFCRRHNFYIGHKFFVNKLKKNPAYLRWIFKQIAILGNKQVKLARQLGRGDLKILSNAELNRRYQKYCQSNVDYYSYGLVLPMFDFQKTTFLSDEIKRFLIEKKAMNYFSILTTPLQDSLDKLQEINLLKILAAIKKKKKIFNLFKKQPSDLIFRKLPALDKKIIQMLRGHTKKFAWIHYVYEGPAADEIYFIDIIKDFIQRKINPSQEIKRHFSDKIELNNNQIKILKKLNPDNYYRNIILLGRDAVYYKILRRNLQTKSYYYMEPILREIGRRLTLSLGQVRMMVEKEIKQALLNNKLNVELLNERRRLVLNVWEKGKNKILVGQAAVDFLRDVKEEKFNIKVKEIKGTTAYPGKGKARVKIINRPEEIKKMERGDILVSASTNPNLMPAIRLASAIVTDEGGLTCHASIVSRELKIPCIVGTGFITRIVKDGDLVEVDATKGVVRKV